MYCNQCGTQIDNNSNFCSYCGTNLNENRNKKREEVFNDSILLKLKPEFHISYLVLKLIPLFIFFSFFFYSFVMVFSGFIFYFNDMSGPNFDLILLIAVSLSFFFIFIASKKRYQNAEFIFYPDRMEYIDGFFNYNRKLLYYKNVRELSMSQNIFQRNTGIGTVRLTTSGITYRSNRANNNGIQVFDIPDIENTYKELKRIVK